MHFEHSETVLNSTSKVFKKLSQKASLSLTKIMLIIVTFRREFCRFVTSFTNTYLADSKSA